MKSVKEALQGAGFEALDEVLYEPEKHHPFCNRFMCAREGCPQCERLLESLPMREGETPNEFTDRVLKEVFTKAKVVKDDGATKTEAKGSKEG